ncbi:MAG: hypothetical protein ACKO7D_08180 [Bacteroidota bacterium]
MKTLKVIFLLLLLSGKLVYSFFWQVNFYFNQQEITRLECENKDKPLMKCNGKCYLAKQLQKAEDELNEKKSKQEQSKNTIKLMEGSTFLAPQKIAFSSNFSFQIESTNFVSYSKNLLAGSTYPIFHPPCLA